MGGKCHDYVIILCIALFFWFVRLSFCHCVSVVVTICEMNRSYNLRQKMAAISGSFS
jgi:hypothetical protein